MKIAYKIDRIEGRIIVFGVNKSALLLKLVFVDDNTTGHPILSQPLCKVPPFQLRLNVNVCFIIKYILIPDLFVTATGTRWCIYPTL